jgi:hypothetical protein
MSGIPWNEEERGILKKMAEKGFVAKDVALVLKSRSLASISTQAASLGLSLRPKETEIDMDMFNKIMKGR